MYSLKLPLRVWARLGHALLLLVASSTMSISLAQSENLPPLARMNHDEIAHLLESRLIEAQRRRSNSVEDLSALLAELSARGVPVAKVERAQLARAWKAAGFLLLEMEGHTQQSADAINIASSLNPDDEALAREAASQRRRLEIVRERLEHAAQARAERAGSTDKARD